MLYQDQRMIIVAPNGARKNKLDHPNLPMTPQEIAEESVACVDAGASMIHLHARTKDGRHSLEIEDNLTVMEEVKKRVADRAIIQLTTEAVGLYAPEQQMNLIKALKPEAASFALCELIQEKQDEKRAAEFFHWAAQENIIAQYIVYSREQLAYYFELKNRGVLPATNHHLLLVLGRYHKKQESSITDLEPFADLLPMLQDVRWATCAFGQNEQKCLLAAAALGGDMRVGFENNLYDQNGTLAASNAAQVEELVTSFQAEGGRIMTADTVRKLFSR